jgi:hypothetical protein
MSKIDLALAWYCKCMCSSAFQPGLDLITAGVQFLFSAFVWKQWLSCAVSMHGELGDDG